MDPLTITRYLNLTVERYGGNLGDVDILLSVEYDTMEITTLTLRILSGKRDTCRQYTIPDNLFLDINTNVIVTLVEVALPNAGIQQEKPMIRSSGNIAEIKVSEIVANSRVSMTHPFISTDPSTKVATISINRTGLYGHVKVSWKSGFPKTSKLYQNFTEGLFSQEKGNMTFFHGEREKSFIVLAIVPRFISRPLIYSIVLDEIIELKENNKGWAKLDSNVQSILDPHGVIRISAKNPNVTVLEGEAAKIEIERTMSTLGAIKVSYQTRTLIGSNPALPGKDYVVTKSSVDFKEGEFRKQVLIETFDDTEKPVPEKNEVFLLELFDVVLLSSNELKGSPRLSTNRIAVINIEDNDDPYGVISFAENSRNVETTEEQGIVQFEIERLGGLLGVVTVEIISIGGGESWTDIILSNNSENTILLDNLNNRDNLATINLDYEPIKTVVTFPESLSKSPQKKTISIKIKSDSILEPDEQFIVFLYNVGGGAGLFGPGTVSLVTIKSNDFYNGNIGFQHNVARLREDGEGRVTLNIARKGENLEDATVSVGNLSNNFNGHHLLLSFLLDQYICPFNFGKKYLE